MKNIRGIIILKISSLNPIQLIKEEIIQYLKDSAHFLVSELASNTYGFTIYSGTVVINKQCFSKTLTETIQNCFAITTIIHEIANV